MQNTSKQINWRWQAMPIMQPHAKGNRFGFKSGVFQLIAMLIIGLIALCWLRHVGLAIAIFALAAAFLSGMLWFPGLQRGFERVGKALAYAVGVGLTWVLLTPIYYVVFSLGHLILKLRGHDPMQRRRERQTLTYWVARQENTDKAYWFRQY